MVLSAGPTYQWKYYLEPTAFQIIARLFFGWYYPCILSAYGIQVLHWIHLLFQSKMLRQEKSSWIWWVFLSVVILFFCVETTTQFLRSWRIRYRLVMILYMGFITCVLAVLVITATVFAIRFFCFVRRDATSIELVGEGSERANRNSTNLARLVVLSIVVFFLSFIATLVLIFVQVGDNPARYFGPDFFVRFAEALACAVVMATFYKMMLTRLSYVANTNTESDLAKPLLN